MSKKRSYRLFFYIISGLICLAQVSCNGDSVTNTNTSSANLSPNISMGSVATIPVLPTVTSISTMVVNNNTAQNLKLTSAIILQNGKISNAKNTNSLVDVSSCEQISANSFCAVAISPPKSSGSFILKLIFSDSNGTKYNGIQIINYSDEVKQENGFVYFKPSELPQSRGLHTLSVPVILENNYSKLNVTTKNVPNADTYIQCPNDKYEKNIMCTVYVTYNTNDGKPAKLQYIILRGKLAKSEPVFEVISQNEVIIPLSISNNNAANLVLATAPNIHVTSGSPSLVTMLNNGVVPATNISYNGLTPLSATTSGGTCGTSLAPGMSCTFRVSVSSAINNSGLGQVIVLYSNGLNQIESLPFNVYYSPQTTTPNLTLSLNGSMQGTLVNSVNYQGIYVLNKGSATLNNIQFSNISSQLSSMGYGGIGNTCVNGQSLAPGSSCVLVVYYAPNAAQAVSSSTFVNIAATAQYTDTSGNTLNYAGGSVRLDYSANSPGTNLGNYVVAGDYGAISANLGSAVITGTTGWTVRNNTPFITSNSITRMVNNGGLYVIGTGGTAAGAGFIYTAPGGLIWQSASGGTNAPPTGATANAITGLTYDSINGYLVTNNVAAPASNLYSISNISGVSPTWTVLTNAFASQPFSLFNFGTASAYIAPLNKATTGQQLAVATAPKTAWAAINPTPAATLRTYIAAISDGSRYCVLSSTKFVACANSAGFTTATAWAQNTTAISASTATNMMANNGSTSYVALGSTAPFVVNLQSPANPATAGTWTSATTQPSAALAWVTYGGGQYVAVSAATPGLIWTSPTGAVWTQQTLGTANSPTSRPYGFIYYDGTNYWAAGTTVLRVSPDGVNWTNAGIQSLTYLYNGATLTYLAAGTAGAIESSTNLTSWVGAKSTTTNRINHIACSNSKTCFAVGQNGVILFSNDGAGAVWNSQTSGTTKNLNSVVCGYTNCVAVGESGTILTQSIGATSWSSQTVGGGTNALNSVTFNNVFNLYVAVGNAGIIYTSVDGVNWINQTSGTTNNLYSVKCGIGSVIGCMAVGNVIGTPTSGTVLTSKIGISWSLQGATTGSNLDVGFYNGNWVVAQTSSTIGGTVRSAPDALPPVWSTAKTSSITSAAAINFNTILAY